MVYKMQKLVMTAAGQDGLPACYCGALTETPSTASRKEQTTEENPLAINAAKLKKLPDETMGRPVYKCERATISPFLPLKSPLATQRPGYQNSRTHTHRRQSVQKPCIKHELIGFSAKSKTPAFFYMPLPQALQQLAKLRKSRFCKV